MIPTVSQVTKIARPLPVEYLLIDVPVASAKEPIRTFHRGSPEFPVENRPMEGHLQVKHILGPWAALNP